MGLPSQPVTLTVEQVSELNRKLSDMRHNINNNLAVFVAYVEMLRLKPATVENVRVSEQALKISESLTKFSREFERVFGITRPEGNPKSEVRIPKAN